MNNHQLFLDELYTIDGVTVTGEQIKEALIDREITKSLLKND